VDQQQQPAAWVQAQQRRRSFLLLLIYAVLILFIVIPSEQSFSLAALWPLLVLLLVPFILVLRMRRIASRRAGRGGEHVVNITPEGIREKTELGESQCACSLTSL